MIGQRAGAATPVEVAPDFGLLIPAPPDWHEQAACQDQVPADWHSPNLDRQRRARSICVECPARYPCALAALESGEPYGIWGGLSVDDRRSVARLYGYPMPNAARHGTRSKYVAGCDAGFGGGACKPCLRAHADYEHQRRLRASASPRKGLAPSDPFPSTPDRAGWDTAPAPPLPRPSTADARFLVDVEAAEVGIEGTWRDDETAIELGRMVCRADAAGWSEADLREVLTGAGLSLRQTSVLLTAARAAYSTLPPAEPVPARRRVRRRRERGPRIRLTAPTAPHAVYEHSRRIGAT